MLGFKQVHLTSLHADPNTPRFRTILYGERTDGVLFALVGYLSPVSSEVLPITIMRQVHSTIQNMLLSLETYRECACTSSVPCETHKDIHNPFAFKNYKDE